MHPCACIPRASNPSWGRYGAVTPILGHHQVRLPGPTFTAIAQSARPTIALDHRMYRHATTRQGFGPATNLHRLSQPADPGPTLQACFAIPLYCTASPMLPQLAFLHLMSHAAANIAT